jgi:pyruvate formate lyase activating enzyme
MTDNQNPATSPDTRVKGWIWNIKKYALHDGPGIRTTVFFKGCPLSCLWCCNPESQAFQPEVLWLREKCRACGRCAAVCLKNAVRTDDQGRRRIDFESCDLCGLCIEQCPGEALSLVGRPMTVDEVLREVNKDSVFHSRSGGGITLSGGEPLAQADFASELLRCYKNDERGLHTAVDTCGHVEWSELVKVLPYTDLFLYDIKQVDSSEHCRLTGVGNELILDNAKRIAESGKALIIRLTLVPGYNDSEENVRLTAEFAKSLYSVEEVDLLPYHRLGEHKYERMEREYAPAGTKAPEEEHLAVLRRIIEEYGLRVRIGG